MRIQIEVTRPRWLRLPRTWRTRALLTLVVAGAVAVPVAWASHQFADVPNTNPHHNDISIIRTAGITQGCNPPANTLYCPDQAVRRDQMASFLQRGLGRTSRGVGSGTFTPLTTTFQTMATATLTVPGSGFVLVNSGTTIGAFNTSNCPCTAFVRLRHNNSGALSPEQLETVNAYLSYTSVSANYVFPVTGPGTHSFSLQSAHYTTPGGSGPFGPFNTIVDATWIPFGSGGASTLGGADPAPTSGGSGVVGAP
jgi:hypothetical protein